MKRRNFFLGLTAAVVGAALELRLAATPALTPPRFTVVELEARYQRLIVENWQSIGKSECQQQLAVAQFFACGETPQITTLTTLPTTLNERRRA